MRSFLSPMPSGPAWIMAATLALAVLIAILFQPGGGDPRADERKHVSFRASDRSGAPSPASKLRKLRGMPPARVPDFATIDRWPRELSDDELRELIGEVTLGRIDLPGHWLRCALYAEWGRRDPSSSLGHLSTLVATEADERETLGALWFSAFRGWAETDMEAAYRELERMRETHFSSATDRSDLAWDWRSFEEALAFVFGLVADPDPAAAGERLMEGGRGVHRAAALRGLWSAADSAAELVALMDDWQARRQHAGPPSSPWEFGPYVSSGFENTLDGQAAIALADLDLAAALERYDDGRLRLIHARRHPDEAAGILRGGRYDPKDRRHLVAGAISGDPHLGPELVPLLESESSRARAIESAAHVLFRPSLAELHPVPDRVTAPPDFDARLAALHDTLRAAGLSREVEQQVRAKLERYFASYRPVPGR